MMSIFTQDKFLVRYENAWRDYGQNPNSTYALNRSTGWPLSTFPKHLNDSIFAVFPPTPPKHNSGTQSATKNPAKQTIFLGTSEVSSSISSEISSLPLRSEIEGACHV